MSRRIPPPQSPRKGMRLHAPTPSADPHADVLAVQFWNGEVDIRSTTNDGARFRALLGRLVHRFAEWPELLDVIAGLKTRKDRAA